jgi:hypothetical protein
LRSLLALALPMLALPKSSTKQLSVLRLCFRRCCCSITATNACIFSAGWYPTANRCTSSRSERQDGANRSPRAGKSLYSSRPHLPQTLLPCSSPPEAPAAPRPLQSATRCKTTASCPEEYPTLCSHSNPRYSSAAAALNFFSVFPHPRPGLRLSEAQLLSHDRGRGAARAAQRRHVHVLARSVCRASHFLRSTP